MTPPATPGRTQARGTAVAEKYLVAYAKIVVDREQGIALQGVYFGGIGDTLHEAEVIAKDCVNNVRGGTILPKVLKLDGQGRVIDALYEATEKFEKVTANMIEADSIINRGRRKK
jgi:hypothetical protein